MIRTTQMLRAKYWILRFNTMVGNAVTRCYRCQISTPKNKQELVKPSEIPQTSWNNLSVDFGGLYPDGYYNLVVINKRTRFPVIVQTTSTSCMVTCEGLRNVFATHGTPERSESDNGRL